jgi:hypothetical protein
VSIELLEPRLRPLAPSPQKPQPSLGSGETEEDSIRRALKAELAGLGEHDLALGGQRFTEQDPVDAVARLFDLQSRRVRPAQTLPLGEVFHFSRALGRADCRCKFAAKWVVGMRFQIISGTSIREFVEYTDSAVDALDRFRALVKAGARNIRILREDGRRCSLVEIKELAEDEADGV